MLEQLSTTQLERPALEVYKSNDKIPVCVILDQVRSGLNVGAIFRTCDAFAIQKIYLCGITAQPPHPEIFKTALGATESVEWIHTESTQMVVRELQQSGYTILPVEQTTHSIALHELDAIPMFPLALIFGNEMKGIQAEVLEMCENSIEIPQEGIKHSLNVATSAGIVLWEIYRQNRLRFLGSAI